MKLLHDHDFGPGDLDTVRSALAPTDTSLAWIWVEMLHEESDPDVLAEACRALGKMGPALAQMPDALDALIGHLRHDNSAVRRAAVGALQHAGAEAAGRASAALLAGVDPIREADVCVRRLSVTTLAPLAARDAAVRGALENARGADPDRDVRTAAWERLRTPLAALSGRWQSSVSSMAPLAGRIAERGAEPEGSGSVDADGWSLRWRRDGAALEIFGDVQRLWGEMLLIQIADPAGVSGFWTFAALGIPDPARGAVARFSVPHSAQEPIRVALAPFTEPVDADRDLLARSRADAALMAPLTIGLWDDYLAALPFEVAASTIAVSSSVAMAESPRSLWDWLRGFARHRVEAPLPDVVSAVRFGAAAGGFVPLDLEPPLAGGIRLLDDGCEVSIESREWEPGDLILVSFDGAAPERIVVVQESMVPEIIFRLADGVGNDGAVPFTLATLDIERLTDDLAGPLRDAWNDSEQDGSWRAFATRIAGSAEPGSAEPDSAESDLRVLADDIMRWPHER